MRKKFELTNSLFSDPMFAIVCSSNPRVMRMYNSIKEFAKDESGATAIEYGLIAALVSVAAVTALTNVGQSLNTMFGKVSSTLDAAVAP